MNNTKALVDCLKVGLGIAMLAVLAGCGGYVGGGYGGVAVVAEPDTYLFGGYGVGYERGRDVHSYSQRGSVSRSVVHVGGGGGGIHVAAGGGGKRK